MKLSSRINPNLLLTCEVKDLDQTEEDSWKGFEDLVFTCIQFSFIMSSFI